MCIVAICFPADDPINFEINGSFLIKLLKFKYFKDENSF